MSAAVLIFVGLVSSVFALDPREIASRAVEKKRQALREEESLRSSTRVGVDMAGRDLFIADKSVFAALGLNKRFFFQGQSWRIAVALNESAQAAKERLPYVTHVKLVLDGVYSFHVESAVDDRAVVLVRHEGSDSDVAKIEIDRKRRVRLVSGRALGMDWFPLSIPAFDDSEPQRVSMDLRIPTALVGFEPLRARVGANAFSYTGTDAFARAYDVVWRRGDPWPALISGPAGISVLLEQNGDSR